MGVSRTVVQYGTQFVAIKTTMRQKNSIRKLVTKVRSIRNEVGCTRKEINSKSQPSHKAPIKNSIFPTKVQKFSKNHQSLTFRIGFHYMRC